METEESLVLILAAPQQAGFSALMSHCQLLPKGMAVLKGRPTLSLLERHLLRKKFCSIIFHEDQNPGRKKEAP